jgi:hypothetical protein
MANNENNSNLQVMGIIAIILALCSYPLVACGGFCCSPFPFLALVLGIIGYMNSKGKDKNTEILSIAAILLSAGALVLLVCFFALGTGLSILSLGLGA